MAARGFQHCLLGLLITAPGISAAFCEDPKTGISGYRIPLKEEIKTTPIILIGKVVEEHEIHDEPTDPEYFSATTYKVVIERALKGRATKTVMLWTPNDSSRYPMRAGERHILFLKASRDGNPSHFEADGCGSSAALPAGNDVVEQVEAAMRPNTSLERTRDK